MKQVGRIKSIMRKPIIPNRGYIPKALVNLRTLEEELPSYWDRMKFTNSENLIQGYPNRYYEPWAGRLGHLVGQLFDVKLIWREKVIVETIEVGKTFLVVGDKRDVTLAVHCLDYCVKAIEVTQEGLVARYKAEAKRQRRLKRQGKEYIEYRHTKEYASNILNMNILRLSKQLQSLLALKPKNGKEAIILRYIASSVKLSFSDKPGPKVPPRFDKPIDWDKASTSPGMFHLNKLIC